MIFSKQIPPVYEKCHEQFGVNWSKGVIITYGDTIYCKYDLTPDKIAHESVHVKQQSKMDKDVWWDRYFSDSKFRLQQELEAYRAEANFIRRTVGDRNDRARLFRDIPITQEMLQL